MTAREESLENGRRLYTEIFSSQFSEEVLHLLEGESTLDGILYAIFNDSVGEGYIQDISNLLSTVWMKNLDISDDESPLFALTGIKLRTLMCASLTVGMWYQKDTNSLDTMWGVDKNSE